MRAPPKATSSSIGIGAGGEWAREFEVALTSPTPLTVLRALAQSMFAAGIDRDEVVAIADEVRASLETQGREADEDIVLDLLDQLTGWCSPHSAL